MSERINNLTLMMENVLESVLEGSDQNTGELHFSDEARSLISDFAEKCRATDLFKESELTGRNFTNGMTATEIWDHMNEKIIDAPTQFHMLCAGVLLIPFADDALKRESE